MAPTVCKPCKKRIISLLSSKKVLRYPPLAISGFVSIRTDGLKPWRQCGSGSQHLGVLILICWGLTAAGRAGWPGKGCMTTKLNLPPLPPGLLACKDKVSMDRERSWIVLRCRPLRICHLQQLDSQSLVFCCCCVFCFVYCNTLLIRCVKFGLRVWLCHIQKLDSQSVHLFYCNSLLILCVKFGSL